MRLPNGHRADLGTKLENYVLNRDHREGRHKAHVFESVVGITLATKEILAAAILDAAANSEDADDRGNNGHGQMYILRFPLKTAAGSAMVMTGWIIRNGENFPRLATCYIM